MIDFLRVQPRLLCPFILVAASLVAGCDDSDGGFVCDGPCVDGVGLSIPNGRPVAGGLPASSNTAAAPVIASAEWIVEDSETLILAVTAEAGPAFEQIYVEVNAQVFIIDSRESLIDGGRLDFCGVLESSQGIACTDACIAACQCLSCADELIEHNARGSCTTTCSIWADNGGIGPGQAYESEVQMVNLLVNGDPANGLLGIADQTECSGGVCAATAERAERRRRTFEFHYDFRAPIPDTTIMAPTFVEPGSPQSDSPPVSEPFAAGSLSPDCCPAYGACAMRCQ